jgi:hypothetical protein
MFEFMEPETVWLNVTNAALGLVTLICLSVVVYVATKEVLARAAKKARVPLETDSHAFRLEDLGITMADGGEKLNETPRAAIDPPNIIRSEN